ncbi:MAG: ABC transporter permease, partial [Cetobacterium sp.]
MLKKINKIGLPRIIITIFLIFLYILAPFVGVNLKSAFQDTMIRVGMNLILVLSLIPMIQGGTGLNFGMPLGIEAGLLGAVISIEL